MIRFLFTCSSKKLLIILFLILLQPISVFSKCICEVEEEDQNSSKAQKLKIVAIASILVASVFGVCLPILAKNLSSYLNPENDIYFLLKAFAAGVILATGFIHILPDAFETLRSPCIGENPWHKFPFTGLVAMLAAIGTLMMESFATGYHKRSELRKAQPVNIGNEENDNNDEGDAHGSHVQWFCIVLERSNSSNLVRHRIISQVLELGIVVHSVIVGISIGASQSPNTIKTLVAALSFHQFFEGMGLGGCISQAQFKCHTISFMVLFFCLTTPIGIVIGIGMSNMYSMNSPTALIVQGLLLSASAGILIYMALVDLLATDFMNPKMLCNFRLQLGANFTLLLGVCFMSLLAKWGEA
ncbi:Zinc transporter protein [Quillaja saponaria]|uniref:Zinc transporter protein n=1 Tax=Quillaja saponaria TaxID=32244 RepID=A0AAD7M3R3_QUISA|nr:Zinc transporter protein [Quillaja saponaria]